MRGSVPPLLSAFLAVQATLAAAGEFEFEAQRFPEATSEYAYDGAYAEGPHGPGCSCQADYEPGCCGHRGCCDPCGCGACWDGCGSPCDRLFGIFARTDYCFNDFISPISNPLFFEDPRQLTEARFIYAHHRVPGDVPIGGGDVNYYALQLRAALNDRLSIIATKDGYIDLDVDNLPHQDGWADVALGLKYTLLRRPQTQTLLSTGLTYQLDVGSHKVFQGYGDGEFHLFLTGGQQIGERSHWLSASGFRLPVDTNDGSQMWYWSNHYDYQFVPGTWYGLIEFNWFHWMRSGAGPLGTSGFEGLDLINLGSTGVAGNDIVTMAAGGKWKPYRNMEIGAAYEFPLTERRDILEDRFYVDLIVRY